MLMKYHINYYKALHLHITIGLSKCNNTIYLNVLYGKKGDFRVFFLL